MQSCSDNHLLLPPPFPKRGFPSYGADPEAGAPSWPGVGNVSNREGARLALSLRLISSLGRDERASTKKKKKRKVKEIERRDGCVYFMLAEYTMGIKKLKEEREKARTGRENERQTHESPLRTSKQKCMNDLRAAGECGI